MYKSPLSSPNNTSDFANWWQQYPHFTTSTGNTTIIRLPPDEGPPLPPAKLTLIQTGAWRKSLNAGAIEQLEIGQLIFLRNDAVLAILPFQVFDVPLTKLDEKVSPVARTILNLSPYFHTWKDQQRVIRILLIGDLFLSDTQHHQRVSPALLDEAVTWLESLEAPEAPVGLKVLKEFDADDKSTLTALNQLGYHSVETEPEMILYLKSSWEQITDYTAAMKTKYRRRYKSARKKGKEICVKTLTLHQLLECHQTLQPLLDNVIAKSSFCLAPENTYLYVQMKKQLKQNFIFKVYQLNEKVIGFSTAIRNGSTLIAHRVGLNYDFNNTHKLYQNILYDYVELALSFRCQSINYGRTALEIKSALGAEPKTLIFVLKHPSWMANQALRWLLYSPPKAKWTQRHPFRQPQAVKTTPHKHYSLSPVLRWLPKFGI